MHLNDGVFSKENVLEVHVVIIVAHFKQLMQAKTHCLDLWVCIAAPQLPPTGLATS